jgi:hypothetical protein
MLKSVLTYLVPFLLTLAAAGAIRFAGGAARGAQCAGIGVVLGFLIAWGGFLKPGWMPGDDFSRIGHIVFGAGLVGLLLDLLSPRRLWAGLAAGVVLLVSSWASVNGSLRFHGPVALTDVALLAGLTVLGFLILARLDAVRERGLAAPVLLTMTALALTVMAAIVGDARLAASGAILAAALLGFVVLQSVVALPVGDAVLLGAGGAVLAIAWALGHSHGDARLGLLLVPLILFADTTARRVPLPKARISGVLEPLVLASFAALPLILATIVVYVMANA